MNRTTRLALRDGLDERTARCALTWCTDGADALMTALLKGACDAPQTLGLLLDAMDDAPDADRRHARGELERLFIVGAARWGRPVRRQGMAAFRRASERWLSRLAELPAWSPDGLLDVFTDAGRQWVVTPVDPAWPRQLDDLAMRSDWAPPLCLWGLGDVGALTSCAKPVAIVGSRGANDYGRYVASTLARRAACDGHAVVSGGAMGTDASAHWGALAACEQVGAERAGRTIAVFAGGLHHMGPARNRGLFDATLASGGALISELCPDTVPEPRRFLLRNRIIAALSSTVVVAQARLRSGALNTARWAGELNREIYAAPGNVGTPDNAGCNELIRDQRAMLLASAEDVDELCHAPHAPHGIDAPTCADDEAREGGKTDEELVLAAVRDMVRAKGPVTAHALHAELRRRDPDRFARDDGMQRALGMLELRGAVETRAGLIRPVG